MSKKDLTKFENLVHKYFTNADFSDAKKHKSILAEMPNFDLYLKNKAIVRQKAESESITAELMPTYVEPLLTKDQEKHLFQKYNFIKYCINNILNEVKLAYCGRKVNKMEKLLQQAIELRNLLASANFRLISIILKNPKYINGYDNSYKESLVSNCYIAIMRAVDGYNPNIKIQFSTYASWTLINESRRFNENYRLYRKRNIPCADLEKEDKSSSFSADNTRVTVNKRILTNLFTAIEAEIEKTNGDKRAVSILKQCYGIGVEPKTLKEIGKQFGVTKERVRQIRDKYFEKMQEIAERRPSFLKYEESV